MSDQGQTPAGGDPIDRLIDAGLRGMTTQAEPADLRARVLARLEGNVTAVRERRLVLSTSTRGDSHDRLSRDVAGGARSALSPAGTTTLRYVWREGLRPACAVAAIAVLGVALGVGWWQWGRPSTSRPDGRSASAAARTGEAASASLPPVNAPQARASAPRAVSQSGAADRGRNVPAFGSGAGQGFVSARLATPRPGAVNRFGFAGSWASADLVVDLDDSPGPHFPGAPVGEAGDPIVLMPPPRPIVIPPLVAVPIADAPPVSTLATPVSTLSNTTDVSRDRPDPGKTGGRLP